MSISAAHAAAFYSEVAEVLSVWTIRDAGGYPAPKNPDGTWKQSITMAQDVSWNQTRYIVDSLKNQWLNPIKTLGTYNSL